VIYISCLISDSHSKQALRWLVALYYNAPVAFVMHSIQQDPHVVSVYHSRDYYHHVEINIITSIMTLMAVLWSASWQWYQYYDMLLLTGIVHVVEQPVAAQIR